MKKSALVASFSSALMTGAGVTGLVLIPQHSVTAQASSTTSTTVAP